MSAAIAIIAAGLSGILPVAAAANGPETSNININSSYNWAGYISNNGTYTAVSGSWIVPQVNAAGNSSGDVTWVGIGGINAHDLIQAGTQAVTDRTGNIDYRAWYELLPGTSVLVAVDIKPGDAVTVTIVKQPDDNNWMITLKNDSNNQTFSKTVNFVSSLSSAEWIEEMPLSNIGWLPLDDFNQIQFTNGWTIKDGVKVNIADSGARTITMNNRVGDALATPSLLGDDGISFTVARTDAESTPAYRVVYARSYRSNFGYGHRTRHFSYVPGQERLSYRFNGRAVND